MRNQVPHITLSFSQICPSKTSKRLVNNMLCNVAPGPSHISPASMNAASTRYCTIEVTKLGLRNTYINPVGH